MNSFSIKLETVSERETPTGTVVEIRSVCDGMVELVLLKPRTGAKPRPEEALGRLHCANLVRVLQALHILAGGGTCQ